MGFPLGPQPGLSPPGTGELARRKEYMVALVEDLRRLERSLYRGGGPRKADRQRSAGKMLARERVSALLDDGDSPLEIGLLVASQAHSGIAPAAGVVTVVGRVAGRPVAVMANDATVKAGSWFPETVAKIVRIQEIAMRCRIPIVYLVDSAGIFLPLQDETFPGPFGGARIFHNCSRMRRQLRIPQVSAVMGPCIAGGAYLPALSDVILMVEGTSFMGLGGPNLVRGATGQRVSAEELGGSRVHTERSGVAHYRVGSDAECLARIRELLADLPGKRRTAPPAAESEDGDGLDSVLPADHRRPYDVHEVVRRIADGDGCLEFMAGCAPELLCANLRIGGWAVGLIANRRGVFRQARQTRIGAIIYAETARKATEFVLKCDRQGHPLVYLQDVTGFMVGPSAEREGIIRAGAEMIESMATTRVPKIVLTLRHASGAGYYAMAGQGFDPEFTLAWPSARIGVMEGESAVQALFASQLHALELAGSEIPPDLLREIESTRDRYERTLDAKWSASQGHVDAIIAPSDTRRVLISCLEAVHSHGYSRIPRQ